MVLRIYLVITSITLFFLTKMKKVFILLDGKIYLTLIFKNNELMNYFKLAFLSSFSIIFIVVIIIIFVVVVIVIIFVVFVIFFFVFVIFVNLIILLWNFFSVQLCRYNLVTRQQDMLYEARILQQKKQPHHPLVELFFCPTLSI